MCVGYDIQNQNLINIIFKKPCKYASRICSFKIKIKRKKEKKEKMAKKWNVEWSKRCPLTS